MNIHVLIATIVCGALFTPDAQAQPSFDCAKASPNAEELICADDALAGLDQRMARTYAAAVSVIDQTLAGKDAALKNLRATQRGWIKGRDDCWKAEDLRACVEAAYLTREGELITQWMLKEPSSVVAYQCQNNRANEVTAFFFDTELPSVRLEYGDSIRSGSLVPAASGSKYATPFGGVFWVKGKGALFAWVEGEEMSCTAAD